MGIYDRDYTRSEPKGIHLGGAHSAVAVLLFVNVAAFVIDFFTSDNVVVGGVKEHVSTLSNWFGLRADVFQTWPWPPVWGLLTYGFMHADVWHLALNMLGLWICGREVEIIYGSRRFCELYFSLLLLSGLAWVGSETYVLNSPQSVAVGASGAVSGVMLVYVLHYPLKTFLMFGVAPVAAWVMATIWLATDLANYYFSYWQARGVEFRGVRVEPIAFSAHLAGALFGYVFYRFRWVLFDLLPFRVGNVRLPQFSSRPRLRLHDPDEAEEEEDQEFEERVDRILAKISAQGTSSLTKEEQRLLESASRKAQQKRKVRTD